MDLFAFRTGATRVVFLVGRWAFKLPRPSSWRSFLQGLLANLQEAEFSGLSDRLAPVLLAMPLGFCVVMPRARPLDRDEWRYVAFSYSRLVAIEGGRLPVERKRCSWGVIGDKIVAVDYGS